MCNLTDICEAQSPCDNGICILLSQPDEYYCNCTGTGFNGPNCSSSGKLYLSMYINTCEHTLYYTNVASLYESTLCTLIMLYVVNIYNILHMYALTFIIERSRIYNLII